MTDNRTAARIMKRRLVKMDASRNPKGRNNTIFASISFPTSMSPLIQALYDQKGSN